MAERLKNIRNTISFMLAVGALNVSALTALAAEEDAATSQKNPEVSSESKNPLMAEFTEQARNYEKLFADGNAEALADLWTSDGQLETSYGQVCRGKQQLKDYFARNFAKFGKQPLRVTITSLESPAAGVVMEKGTTSIGSTSPSGRYTALHVKKDNGWKMSWVMESAFQDRDITSVKALGWLSGKWKSAPLKGDTVEITAKWIENGSFLECTTYDTELKSEVKQIIGYSPLLGTLVSWHFAPGGFGQGEWSRLPDGWRQQSNGVSQNGTRTSATYTLKQRSKDSFTWQSTHRSINGVSIPDSAILVLNRVSE